MQGDDVVKKKPTMLERLDAAGAAISESRRAHIDAKEAGRELAIEAAANGVPETHIANRLMMDRLTIRNWLGKPR
jgi:hypothetical protein